MAPTRPSRDSQFSAAVTAVTAAFGDPTRREIYLFVRSNPGATASEVAERFSLHPNVARHHLDRLATGGYVEVTMERAAGNGAGRPSKRFRAIGNDPTLDLLTRRDDLLVLLLQEALQLLGPAAAEGMAERVGEEYGRTLAGQMSPGDSQRSLRTAMHAIADTLTAHGFAAHAEDQGASTAVVADNCPFGNAASQYPVLCAVDRGMVKGLLAGLCGEESGGRCRSSVLVPGPRRRRLRCRGLTGSPPVARHYLDHASATPLRPEARAAMAAWDELGVTADPGRVHTEGRMVRVALEDARTRWPGCSASGPGRWCSPRAAPSRSTPRCGAPSGRVRPGGLRGRRALGGA